MPLWLKSSRASTSSANNNGSIIHSNSCSDMGSSQEDDNLSWHSSSTENKKVGKSSFFTLPFRRKRYVINPPDDNYNVIYLGNVLTVMAKGDGCVDKPLNLIWKTYCQKARPDLHMRLAVTRSGLKAETRQQGHTDYWAHRITYCVAPFAYPRVFCWVYKHEGRKMKPELRCHAVLCRKPPDPVNIALKLHEFLQAALAEYKREKMSTQNARLSAASGSSEGSNSGRPGCPRRKQLLRTGTLNFRPPVSRSKSAPRLGSIDEEDDDELNSEQHQIDDTNLDDDDDDEVNVILSFAETPRPLDGDSATSSSSDDGGEAPFLRCRMQIAIGDAKFSGVNQCSTSNSSEDPDTVSDESGYHEFCSSSLDEKHTSTGSSEGSQIVTIVINKHDHNMDTNNDDDDDVEITAL